MGIQGSRFDVSGACLLVCVFPVIWKMAFGHFNSMTLPIGGAALGKRGFVFGVQGLRFGVSGACLAISVFPAI